MARGDLPQPLDAIRIQRGVATDQRQALGECLPDEKPIERIAMMEWHRTDPRGVRGEHRKN